MKIFFFHHAGGDQYAFRNLKPLIEQQGWQGIYCDYPGHGERFGESLLSDIHLIANETFEKHKNEFSGEYAFFGVSMGTLVSYLITQKLRTENKPLPKHFIAASRKCPDSHRNHPKSTHLESDEFWQNIAKYGGCPPGLIEHEELRALYEPIIRADFKALENYQHIESTKFDVPATILFGKKDRLNEQDLEHWQNHFEEKIEIIAFDGGHFFCYEQPENVMEIIKKTIELN
jgi:surfactin synthase thioesterase subunit